ncbi:hypothetical protein HMN09_01073900 [Mycena chlorophos]|uniref:Uncharacterized protein n=1 Tax=Mycena chlorophos TaxID=658473 RepID=A0A8H6SC11_MYCCL|nr:hypothetical protein HMN09_01073900 [Mycena chlorophos]
MKDLTKTAFQRWIRALAGIISAQSTLTHADDYIKHYEQRFVPVDDLREHIKNLVEQSKKPNAEIKQRASRLLTEVKGQVARAEGQIAKDIAKISCEHLSTAFATIIAAGLLRFYPDVFGNTSSAYNKLHRHLAVATFQDAVSAFGLTRLQVSITAASDTTFLNGIFDKFMVTLARVSKRAERNPESLEDSAELEATTKRRGRLCTSRYEQAKTEGLRVRVVCLIGNPECHSDDEVLDEPIPVKEPGEKPYKILTQARVKVGRHPGLTGIMRHLDSKILDKWIRNRKGPRPNTRKTDELLPPSALSSKLPAATYTRPDHEKETRTPLDFFSPQYFNDVLDVEEKSRYAAHGVGMAALDDAVWNPTKNWATMGTAEFRVKYEPAALAQYSVPTEEEMEQARLRREKEEHRKKKKAGGDDDDSDDEVSETDLEDTDVEDAMDEER